MKERLKQIRQALGLTQAEFAKRILVTGNYIYMLESGKKEIADRTVQLICKEFDVSEQWFREGTGEMFARMSKEKEVARIAAQMFKDDESSYRYKLQRLISKMNDHQMEILLEFINTLLDE